MCALQHLSTSVLIQSDQGDDGKMNVQDICPPPIPQSGGTNSKLMTSADGSSDSQQQLPICATSTASARQSVIRPQPRHLFRMYSLQESSGRADHPLQRTPSCHVPECRTLTINIGSDKQAPGAASQSVSPCATPRKQLAPDDPVTPRKRLRKMSFPKRSSMGGEGPNATENPFSRDEIYAAEMLQTLDLDRGSAEAQGLGAGSGESDNTMKAQGERPSRRVPAATVFPDQECDSLFPLRCHVPRKFRTGGVPEGADEQQDVDMDHVELLTLNCHRDEKAVGGGDALSPTATSPHAYGGDGLLTCGDCGRCFKTLKALAKCNACYQSHWRNMKRQRERHPEGGYSPSPPSSPCSTPHSPAALFRKESIPSSVNEEPHSPMERGSHKGSLVPPPVPVSWAQNMGPVLGAGECIQRAVSVDAQTDWVISLQHLLQSYQDERDPSKLYELRDKINEQLPPSTGAADVPGGLRATQTFRRYSAELPGIQKWSQPHGVDLTGPAGPSTAFKGPQRKAPTPRRDWHQYPGVCTPMKKPCPPKRVRQLEALLNEGLITDGEHVFYRSKQGECLAQGIIRGAGIECLRCGRVVACTEFEQCAGSAMRKPCQHIIATGSGLSLQHLMQQLPQRDS